jgi:undecaprenyl-diphosphatase
MTRQWMLDYIADRDHWLMRRANNWPAPRWIRGWMIAATRCGDGWLWYAVGALLLAVGGRSVFPALAAAATAAFAGTLVFTTLKRHTKRRRPCDIEPHCWATQLPPDQFSFPSGHTITAFAVAVSVGLFYPALLVALLFCACNVGASRVLLGMHFLSDVAVGAMLGGFLGYAAWALYT